MVEWENDKPTVVALREIAEGHINQSILGEKDQVAEDILDLDQMPSALPDNLLKVPPTPASE